MKEIMMTELKRLQNHHKAMGGYNDPLPNMKEVSEDGIWEFFAYGAKSIGYRQMDPKRLAAIGINVKYFMNVHILAIDDNHGVAMHFDTDTRKIRYFTWAVCVHEFREPTAEDFARGVERPAMCYHVSVCKKCGYVRTVDSSG